ncbi:MAG: hypothetical protein QXO35_01285 [Candidatus Micrarchaeia archaeon]
MKKKTILKRMKRTKKLKKERKKSRSFRGYILSYRKKRTSSNSRR